MISYWIVFVLASVLGAYVPWIPSASVRDTLIVMQLALVLLVGNFSGLEDDGYCGDVSAMLRRAGSTYCPYVVMVVGVMTFRAGESRQTLSICCVIFYGFLLLFQMHVYRYVRRVEATNRRIDAIMHIIHSQEQVSVVQVLDPVAVESPETDWECSICLESDPKSGISKRECGHVFHTECATAAAIRDPRCPLCRSLPT